MNASLQNAATVSSPVTEPLSQRRRRTAKGRLMKGEAAEMNVVTEAKVERFVLY